MNGICVESSGPKSDFPASSKRTDALESSDNRDATIPPADPLPTDITFYK